MASDAKPPRSSAQRSADDDRLREIAHELADAVDAAVPGWIEGLVLDRIRSSGRPVTDELADAAARAGATARDDVGPRVRALLATDVDRQRANPLALLRSATRHAHEVLADAGVPPVARDEFAERSFPEDRYDLVPAAWDDIDPALREVGIRWGAAKAFVFKARRRDEGRT